MTLDRVLSIPGQEIAAVFGVLDGSVRGKLGFNRSGGLVLDIDWHDEHSRAGCSWVSVT